MIFHVVVVLDNIRFKNGFHHNALRTSDSFLFNWYLSNEETAFVDKSRVEPTIFFIGKIFFL